MNKTECLKILTETFIYGIDIGRKSREKMPPGSQSSIFDKLTRIINKGFKVKIFHYRISLSIYSAAGLINSVKAMIQKTVEKMVTTATYTRVPIWLIFLE